MKLFKKSKSSEIQNKGLGKEKVNKKAEAPVKKVKRRAEVVKAKGQERMKTERLSIFAKLITSHIFIGAVPMLIVALIILNLAQKGILDEVQIPIPNR